MKWIKAEGVDFKYIFPEDDIMKEDKRLFTDNQITSTIRVSLLRESDLSSDLYDILQNGDDTRLAVFKIALPSKTKERNMILYDAPYCIIWPENDVNLTELDQRVRNDTFSDDDFSSSIKTHVKRVLCRNCREEYIGLVVDNSDIYVEITENGRLNPLMFEILKKRIHKHKYKKCPNCNTPFTIYVAKILYKCEDKRFI